jgi:hypothetical protein
VPGTPGRKRSWTDADLADAVRVSRSIRQVLAHLGRKVGGAQHTAIKRRIRDLGLDVSHFTGQGWNKGDPRGLLNRRAIRPFDEILVEDSTYACTSDLKARLLGAGMLVNRCAICDLPPIWNDQPLVLRLDHVNGNNRDHRLDNLRLLCPNCDSQTPTFAGRNRLQNRRKPE